MRRIHPIRGKKMSVTAVKSFDRTIEKTNIWINGLLAELEWDDPERGYQALRAVLHALRDRLSVEEATDLGAQLPMLVRGIYYEGWSPSGKPLRERTKDAFLAHVSDCLRANLDADMETISRAVFKVIAQHVTGGEVDDVKDNLPLEIRALWPK
jgi:uncharacterized protein (DUF2267 family)